LQSRDDFSNVKELRASIKAYNVKERAKNKKVRNESGRIHEEYEGGYCVDLKGKTCDCKRWQLMGIPCHHDIACYREDMIDP
jgi:hypothetical protein